MKHDPEFSSNPQMIPTEDGEELEAEIFVPHEASFGVVIAHPHPLHGGDMHSPVTTALWDALESLGVAGLRFNFRGVGASTGTHDGGTAEQLDVAAAVRALRVAVASATPAVGVALAGWSFGADVSLAVTEVDEVPVAGWFLVAPPLRLLPESAWAAAAASATPKYFACPAHDQFRTPDAASAFVDTWTATEVHPIAGADHFLAGRTHLVVDQFAAFTRRFTP